jgi:hypothetical protein
MKKYIQHVMTSDYGFLTSKIGKPSFVPQMKNMWKNCDDRCHHGDLYS